MNDPQPVLDSSVVSPSSLPGVFWVAGARSGVIRKTIPFISLIDETSHVQRFLHLVLKIWTAEAFLSLVAES